MSGRIRVLMAGPDPGANGGVATVARNYIEGDFASLCDLCYVVTMVEGSKARKLLVAARAFIVFLRRLGRADIVHLHLSKGASYVRKRLLARLARRAGVPYILHLHTGEFDQLFDAASEKKKSEVRELFGAAAAVIALSEEWRDYLAANVCIPGKIEVLHNAVDIPVSTLCPVNSKVLFLGRLDGNKSPDVLIRAGVALVSRHPGLHLIFAGDGDVGRYEDLARQLGIDGRCEFLGWVSDERESLLTSCSTFCLPSRAEGMPMSLLEAMAHSMAVVTTPVGGIPQVVDDGVNGLLVPVGDDVALAEALDSVLSDKDLRIRVGRAARRTVESGFGMKAHLRELLRIYRNSMLSGGRRSER